MLLLLPPLPASVLMPAHASAILSLLASVLVRVHTRHHKRSKYPGWAGLACG